jgi:hypothetical protein
MTDTADVEELLDRELPTVSGIATVAADLRDMLRDMESFDMVRATPSQRSQMVEWRYLLLDWIEPLRTWLNRLDAGWREAAERSGARQFPLHTGGVVSVDEAPTTYSVQEQQLRSALLAHVRDGLLAQEDVDRAITPMTTYKVDNRVLNTLARNRGTAVAETIEKYRQKVAGTAPARVVYPPRTRQPREVTE